MNLGHAMVLRFGRAVIYPVYDAADWYHASSFRHLWTASLAALLKQFLSIAFLTGKPYDLPATRETLKIAVTLAFVTYVAATLGIMGFGRAVGHALLDLVMSGLVFYVGLSFFGKLPRFTQAFSAYCGAGSVVNLATLPIIYTSRGRTEDSGIIWIELVFWIWSISVLAHVLRFSFDINIPVSIVSALCYIMLAVTIFDIVFPA